MSSDSNKSASRYFLYPCGDQEAPEDKDSWQFILAIATVVVGMFLVKALIMGW